jgi:hypothetical protein
MILMNSFGSALFLVLIISSVILLMISYVYPKRYFGELTIVLIAFTLLLFTIKDFAGSAANFFSAPTFSVDLLSVIVLGLIGLAFVISLIRLFKKIMKKKE